ncbi:MAG: AMP-binding protein [Deltaproteobacteria bacterium]|nr:AMP-binding protein [Deltaproteobacteria bacterium]
MWPGFHAQRTPDKPAIIMAETGETLTYAQLDAASNRLAHLLHDRGLRFGDHIALLMENTPRYFEVAWAAQRSGLIYTPINFHLTAEEASYIIGDCDARAFITTAAQAAVAQTLLAELPAAVTTRLVAGGALPGYERYEDALATCPSTPLTEELEGAAMLYSSGTTGRPKGVMPQHARAPVGSALPLMQLFSTLYGIDADSIYLSPAPLYHAAPNAFCMTVLRAGGTVVVMERFEPEAALAHIERYRVTHSQWVPTMFVRLLKLPEAARRRHDLSTLRIAIHAAAPCPVPVKEQMIAWWGPILLEYYSSTEGVGATVISSQEWLAHKGSVGRVLAGRIHILDDDGNELPLGEPGRVFFEPNQSAVPVAYHKDPEKTAKLRNPQGWASVGDIGYLDAEGYLYLTDRKDFMIVAGGVNIYPQEIENLLVTHPKVADVAVFGVPNDELGEEVKAVVQPADPHEAGPALAAELQDFCRQHLARYKCPRSIDFTAELPRAPTGKLYKRLLRDAYWKGRQTKIV